MIAVTVITVASLPVYSILFHVFGVVGLAWASDIGIGINLVALAGLLHYRKLVLIGELRWGELGKAAITAVIAGAISFEVAKAVPLSVTGHASRLADVKQLVLVSLTWGAAVAAGSVAAAFGVATGFTAAQGRGLSSGGAGREQGDFRGWKVGAAHRQKLYFLRSRR